MLRIANGTAIEFKLTQLSASVSLGTGSPNWFKKSCVTHAQGVGREGLGEVYINADPTKGSQSRGFMRDGYGEYWCTVIDASEKGISWQKVNTVIYYSADPAELFCGSRPGKRADDGYEHSNLSYGKNK